MFRDNAYIHDSYHCKLRDQAMFGKVHPYPTQRDGGYWIGCGPARANRIDKIALTIVNVHWNVGHQTIRSGKIVDNLQILSF